MEWKFMLCNFVLAAFLRLVDGKHPQTFTTTFRELSVANANPCGLTAFNGDEWIQELPLSGGVRLAQIDGKTGTIKDFTLITPTEAQNDNSAPCGLVAGADGNLYGGSVRDNRLFRVSPKGEIKFLPKHPLGTDLGILDITAAPDSIFFSLGDGMTQAPNTIVRYFYHSSKFQTYTTNTNGSITSLFYADSGFVYFNDKANQKLARLKVESAVVKEYTVPSRSLSQPQSIGAIFQQRFLYFSSGGTGALGVLDTVKSKFTAYEDQKIFDLCRRGKRTVWFTTTQGNYVGLFDTRLQKITEYSLGQQGTPSAAPNKDTISCTPEAIWIAAPKSNGVFELKFH